MDMSNGYIPMNRSFRNGGYNPIELTEDEKTLAAEWEKPEEERTWHTINTVIGSLANKAARENGTFNADLHDKFVERAKQVLQNNGDRDTSPANVCIELREEFESIRASKVS